MPIPEMHFKNSDEVIKWHNERFPESYQEYLCIRERIKASNFPGSNKLIKNVDNNKGVTEFISFLAELNLADVFLKKEVTNLCYEPKGMPSVDFCCEDVAISVKNLHPKAYEKKEKEEIDRMKTNGGGSIDMTHKNFSRIEIKVEEMEKGLYGCERLETGNSGFLDSDLYELSAPLRYIAEFEEIDTQEKKKVLLFFIQSDEFSHYYIQDIIIWYFGYNVDKYRPIFENDLNWYGKLFRKSIKRNNIDALVFIYAPNTLLSWPPNCLKDIRNKKPRLIVWARNKEFKQQLEGIFL